MGAHHETGRKCIGGGVMFLHGALPIPSGEKLLLSRHNDFNWDNYYTPWIGLNISGNIDSAANNNEDSKPNNSQSKGKKQDNESGSMSERLKWILSETMGAPNAFELHRKELRQEKRTRLLYSDDNIDEDDVTDEEVCRSYVKECSPTENGAIGLYLSYAKLAHHETGRKCIGGGVMFLHGALPIPSGETLLLSRHNDFNWDNYY